MPYPNLWKKLEQKYGEPMETLLPRKANELGTLKAVAREFDVRYETIWKWGKRIELARVCEYRASTERPTAGGR